MADEETETPVVVLASDECAAAVVETMKGEGKPDFTVTAAKVSFHENAMVVSWETVSAGFGEISFYYDDDGVLTCDTECMSTEFVGSVLAKVAESVRVQ